MVAKHGRNDDATARRSAVSAPRGPRVPRALTHRLTADAQLPLRSVGRAQEDVVDQAQGDCPLIGRVLLELLLDVSVCSSPVFVGPADDGPGSFARVVENPPRGPHAPRLYSVARSGQVRTQARPKKFPEHARQTTQRSPAFPTPGRFSQSRSVWQAKQTSSTPQKL
jgi:hypothetical protein